MSNESICQVSVSGWQRFTYVGDASQYQDVQNVVDDPSENWSEYYQDNVLPKSTLPLTLALIWITILLTYLVWRIVLIIDRCCCGIRRHQQNNYDKCVNLLTGRASFFSKITLLLFGICTFGWYVYGIALLASEPNLVSNGFDVVENLEAQLDEVVTKSFSLQSSVKSIPTQIQEINQTVADQLDESTLDQITQCVTRGVGPLQNLSSIEGDLSSLRQTLSQTVQPSLNQLNSQIPQLKSSVSPLMAPLVTEEKRNAGKTAFQNVENALSGVQNTMQDITNSIIDGGRAQQLQQRLNELQGANNELSKQRQALDEIDQILQTYGSTIQTALTNIGILVNTSLPLQKTVSTLLSQANQSRDAVEQVLPCLDGLISNLQGFNDTVFALPSDAAQLLQTLQQWRLQLAVVQGSNPLLQQLNQISGLLEFARNSRIEQVLGFNVAQMRSNLQALEQSLQQQSSSFSSSSGLQTALARYLQAPSSALYQQLKVVVQMNVGTLNETYDEVRQQQGDVDEVYSQLITFNQIVNGELIDFQSLQQQLPQDSELQQLQQDIASLQGDNFTSDLQRISTLSQQINQQVDQAIGDLLGEVNVIVNEVSRTINSSMNTLQIDVINRIQDFNQDHRSDAEQIYETIQIVGIYIFFPVIILLIVAAIIFTIANFTFGMELALFSIISVTLVIVIVGLISATASVVDNDVCAHADVLIVHEVEKEWGVNKVIPAFVRHVLYGNEGGIESILRRYFNYDHDQIIAQINLLNQKVKTAFDSLGSSPGERVDEILNLIQQFPSRIDVILGLLSYTQLNVFYVQLEDVSCCQLREFVTSYNQIVALAGFVTILVIVALFVWLHWLRKLPPSRFGCAICYCRNAGEFKLELPSPTIR